MNIFKKSQWSPYVAGALIGMVSWFAVLTAGKYLGVSTTFVRTIGMIESLFVPERVASMPYFVKEKPIIDWQWMEVLGILIGAFIAARLSGEFKGKFVPSMWEKRFGSDRFKRWFVAFLGGIILMFGARMADG
ncbi:MAG: YeeE/YedE thiosulfate transporter family protein [Thermodesulfobacteriota bacterium]|nr:YeeE/YedE thiosulfate transporter family protein [Thermodesulfobacteriota bacterium]